MCPSLLYQNSLPLCPHSPSVGNHIFPNTPSLLGPIQHVSLSSPQGSFTQRRLHHLDYSWSLSFTWTPEAPVVRALSCLPVCQLAQWLPCHITKTVSPGIGCQAWERVPCLPLHPPPPHTHLICAHQSLLDVWLTSFNHVPPSHLHSHPNSSPNHQTFFPFLGGGGVGYAMQLAAVEAQSPNHWPAREFPPSLLMYLLSTHKHTPESADLKNKGKGKPRTSLNNTSLFQQLFHCSAFFYSQPDWKTWLYLSPGTFGLFDHDP